MQDILDKIFQFFSTFSPSILFLLVIIFGLYVYWRGSMETRKNRSSVFDIFIISIFLGLFLGRVIYVVTNWNNFIHFWYWIPYERSGNEIYWFRLLPWSLMNIFDGGLYILGMFLGFVLSANLFSSVIKKWRWNQTFPTIFFSGETMLAFSFILLGLGSQNIKWVIEGAVLLVFPIISLFCIKYVNKIEDALKEKKIYMLANILLILLATVFIGYLYLLGNSAIYDQVFAIIFILWSFFGLIAFIRDSKKSNIVIEKVSSVRSIDINQPIKLPR